MKTQTHNYQLNFQSKETLMKNANQIRNIIPSFRNFLDRSSWRRGFFLVPLALAAPCPVCLNRGHKTMANRILRAMLSLLVILGSFLLVPHSLYAQTTTFTDVTVEAGFSGCVTCQLNSTWCASWADYDHDGYVDVITLGHIQNLTGSISQLWHNNGNGTFTDVTYQAGLDPHNGDAHGAVWADFDGDGWVDLYVAKGTEKSEVVNYNDLWRNNGDGTFTNIRDSAGVEGLGHRNRGANAVDYDNDSDLDILATSFQRPTTGGGENLLYRNNGDLTFTDVAAEAGIQRPLIENRMAAWADFDGDGWMDVFITHSSGLYKNNGDGTFTDVTVAAGIIDGSDDVQGGAWGDYDNDGYPDLYLTLGVEGGGGGADGPMQGIDRLMRSPLTIEEEEVPAIPLAPQIPPQLPNILYHNNGDGTFTDVTTESGTSNVNGALGVVWEDYDNDGYLDLYIVNTEFASTPNRLFRNNGDGTFTDMASEAGVEAKTPGDGRGSDASFFDYNNDGFPDLFVNNGAGTSVGDYMLFRNNGNSNRWLKVVLKGRQSNRSGIGAKVVLTAGGQTQFREYTGQHYMGQNYVPIHFGLGQAAIVDSLTIKWPSGVTRTLHNIAVNQTITIREARR
jgi:enediyne biosynthesis protein E4